MFYGSRDDLTRMTWVVYMGHIRCVIFLISTHTHTHIHTHAHVHHMHTIQSVNAKTLCMFSKVKLEIEIWQRFGKQRFGGYHNLRWRNFVFMA